MEKALHQNQAAGDWFALSLPEQLGNVGSEVGRAAAAERQGNQARRDQALTRAYELLDLTIADQRWRRRCRELCRVREVLGDTFYGDKYYKDSPQALEKYFYWYAFAARKDK